MGFKKIYAPTCDLAGNPSSHKEISLWNKDKNTMIKNVNMFFLFFFFSLKCMYMQWYSCANLM